MYFHNMDVVKIKCGNSFSEIEVKGHQAVLTVFHTVKTKKAKLQYFLSFFSKFQFLVEMFHFAPLPLLSLYIK
jgi:hypothetical protein